MANIATIEDLLIIEKRIIEHIDALGVRPTQKNPNEKRWVKSGYILRCFDDISPGKLTAMRRRQEIPSRKIGHIYFYDLKAIEEIFNIEKSS